MGILKLCGILHSPIGSQYNIPKKQGKPQEESEESYQILNGLRNERELLIEKTRNRSLNRNLQQLFHCNL